jgi:hypothetical protein
MIVRTLKDFLVGYWKLCGFVCSSRVVRWRGIKVSFVVVVGESASALRDRRVCVEVV